MPPKVRRPAAAKALAKAKVAPVAGGRRRIRRPGAGPGVVGVVAPEGGYTEEKFDKGELVVLDEVPLNKWKKGEMVRLPKASYYGKQIGACGRFQSPIFQDGEKFVKLVITGTDDEELLKHATGVTSQELVVHLCKEGCGRGPDTPMEVHSREGQRIAKEAESGLTWETNIESAGVVADDLVELRRRQEEALKRGDEKKETKKAKKKEEEDSAGGKEKKKKKKRKREKSSSSGGDQSGGEKEVKKKAKLGGRTSAQKTTKALYARTGLDPRPKIRKRIANRVKKSLKRVKTKGSSSTSGSSSSSSGSTVGNLDVLDDHSKIRQISVKGPGLLSSSAIEHMIDSLRELDGSWGSEVTGVPPIVLKFVRTVWFPACQEELSRNALLWGRP